jgi:Tfp pilus assembly protein PilF
MLEKDPEDLFLSYALALEYRSAGENSAAISVLESILKKDADYLAAYYQLGKLYEENGQHEEAERVYSAGILIAQKAGNRKTQGELQTALDLL